MEPASLVLGVLSFIVGGMQSYEKARQTFQTFRAYKRAVLRMKARLETQHTRFNNECKLILRLVVPTGGELKSMFEDTSHTRWKDQSLDNDLKVCLGSNYGPYRGTLECCRDSLEEVIRALSWMRNVSPSAGDGETGAGTIGRIGQALRVSLHETHYVKLLKDVESSNGALAILREQVYALKQLQQLPSMSSVPRKPLPLHLTAVRQVAHRLYDSLKEAWCCTNVSHTGHQAKVWIDAETENIVCLDMAISSHTTCFTQVEGTAAEQRVWLYVKSTVTTQSNVSVLPPTALLSQLVPCAQGQERKPPIASLTDTREGKPLVVGSRARKQKRVRFTDIKLKATQAVSATQDSDVIPADTGAAENMSSISPSNLRELQDICRHLSKATPSSEQDCQGTCLGYLETQNSCRLLFYNAAKVRAKSSIQSLYDKETVLLSKVVQQLSIFHQLEVAHKLAIALLQYHATSWLADSWRLQDLSFFAYQERGVKQMLEDLKTLHLSVQFPEACPSHIQLREDADSNRMESTIPVIRDKSTEQDICIPLISLGVALLEIGLGRDLQEEKQGLEPDKLTIARRMVASNDTRLGPKYQSVIRACLQCKFGFGFDLGTEELQDAVYSQVICQLEDMIRDVKSVL